MEEEEAAEARRRQEREEKKKKLAELAEARKAEEAAAAAEAEAARKAMKKAAKRRADTQGPDKANKKQKSTDEFDRVEELAREGCRMCVANSFIDFSSSNFLLDVSCKKLTAYELRDREARHASHAIK